MLKEIRAYFREMDVSTRLADDMLATEPKSVHILTHEEINKYGLGGRLFLRYLAECRVALQPELVDLGFRVRDGGLGVVPCKADFEGRKRNAVDGHGF